MTLATLIQKNGLVKVATAIPAIPATDESKSGATIAKIATVAVANPGNEKTGAGGRLAGIAGIAVATSPMAINAETGAVAAKPRKTQPIPPMTAGEEAAIRAWLAHIEEADPAIITEVLNRCRADAEARSYFIRRAGEVPRSMDNTTMGQVPPIPPLVSIGTLQPIFAARNRAEFNAELARLGLSARAESGQPDLIQKGGDHARA